MKLRNLRPLLTIIFILLISNVIYGQTEEISENTRAIEFPDLTGYMTLKCDLHMHTVFSDGSVWPGIRVQEALRDGLDAIAITDHIEYQPHRKDIPKADLNSSFELAQKAAKGTGLMVIPAAEITRSMPPGHFNALFIKDVNKLDQADVMEVFREAKKQGGFLFWNHPHWTSQKEDGVAELTGMHRQMLSEGLFSGIEIYNDNTYSQEALQIALEYNLAPMGNSDLHGLVDWVFDIPEGGHRPVTLVFAKEKSIDSMKEAMENRRTAVWFKNTLVGPEEFLAPLVEASLEVSRTGRGPVTVLQIHNLSDADYILENLSPYSLHNFASVFILKAHETTTVMVKTHKTLDSFELKFRVLNAFISPENHPEISIKVR
jgi:3',5'-nucleoside bisphosphate phosphatase